MVRRSSKYGILDIQSDAGILFGIICAAITLYHFVIDHESVTLYNAILGFIISSMIMVCVFVAQNCTVKGLAGPTLAIIYSQSLFCTILQMIFQGIIPTVWQLLGALVAFSGIVLIILLK